MAIDANSGQEITIEQAQEFVKSFRGKFPGEIKGSFIGAASIKKITDQNGCIGIRFYHGYDDTNGVMNLVLVGVDENEKDMTRGIIMERLLPCPTYCDPASELYDV